MRIGVTLPLPGRTGELASLLEQVVWAEERGFQRVATPNLVGRGFDALTLLALAGRVTRTIALETAVVPTYPLHPTTLAQQALTVQAASGNRLTLGIGLSHRVVIEATLGLDWSRPIRHTREYLGVLLPALAGEEVNAAGDEYRVTKYRLTVPGATAPPVLLAALGDQMLRLAGRSAAGTSIWMGGARYLAEHAVPTIQAAARDAGRPAPRVVASVPVCVTDRVAAVQAVANKVFQRYGELPSYRAILDKEGATAPADVALIGDEATVRARLDALAAAGATDFSASVFALEGEDPERSYALLRAYSHAAGSA